MTCNARFLLSGYVSSDDDGSGFLYQLTESDGGPFTALAAGNITPCGTSIGGGCDTSICPDNKTLVRQWQTTLTTPVSILGPVLCSFLGRSINPWGTYYRQSFTCDFTIERGGVTVFSSGPFTQFNPGFAGATVPLTSLSSLYFNARVGDVLILDVYTVIAMNGCRADDGIRPELFHGGGPGAFLDIPRIAADPLASTAAPDPTAFAALIYPTLSCQAWPVLKRYHWATSVAANAGALETRVSSWSAPLLEWELSYEVARSGTVLGTAYTEFEQLIGFYTARRGQKERFLFDDVTDNQVVDQALGTGDGATIDFVLSRTAGAHTSPIGRVNAIGDVKIDGVPTTDYTIAGNVLTFTTAPAADAVLTWSGSFYWVVRFADPEAEFGNFADRLWELKKLKLRQLRV